MKRLFTIAVFALAASLTFAQVPLAGKAVSNHKLERIVNVKELSKKAKETREKHAVMAEKAATATEVSTSVLRKNSSLKAYPFSSMDVKADGKVVCPFLPGGFRSEALAKPYKSAVRKTTAQEGNVTVTTDANGIITDVAGVEPKEYIRSTTAVAYYYYSGLKMTNQSGTVTIVEDGNNVWIKDIITEYATGAWVKGVKNGNTITVATRQPLQYSTQYDVTLSLRWSVISAEGKVVDATGYPDVFTFTVDGNVLTLEGTKGFDGTGDAPFMSVCYDDDDSFAGYGDAETVLTYDDAYVVPSTELVALPAGLEVADWYMNGVSVSSSTQIKIKNRNISVAFAGNDVYVQGLTTDFPTAWVKGTVDGTTVKFDKFQYVGAYQGSIDCWFVGVNPGTGELIDVTATYNAEDKTITFNDDILINADAFKVYYLSWFENVVLSAEMPVVEDPVITELTATLPYTNTFETAAEQAQAAIYDANEDQNTFKFVEHDYTESMVAQYGYHADNAADDYLVFPGFELKAGTVYKVALDVASKGTQYPERLEVVAGKEAKASQLNIPVIASTEVTNTDFVTIRNDEFSVAEDGIYYIAVHAISDADQYNLYIDNFSIKEFNYAAPATVSDLAVVADAQGANKATVTFTVPSETLGGAAITEDVTVVVKREGTEVYSAAKAAGAAVTFEDDVEAAGYYTYSVEAFYGENYGDAASVQVYIGYDKPNVVENVTVADKSGAIAMTWDAPTTGANGYVINPADFKYNIYPVELIDFFGFTFPMADYGNPYVTGVTETSANFALDTNSGAQGYTYFAITAENTTGESDDVYAGVLTGAPYQMPVVESFADGLSYWWGFDMDDANSAQDPEEVGLFVMNLDSDGDGKSIGLIAGTEGWISFQSGKIDLAGTVNPTLTFDYGANLGSINLTVSVVTPNGKTDLTTFQALGNFTPKAISLADYKDEDWVRVIFTASYTMEGIVCLDNIRVYNMLDNNLVAGNISATPSVEAGDDVTISVDVENQGVYDVEAGAYTVDLYCNDAKVESLSGTALAKNAKTTFTFTEHTGVMTASELVWKAVVEFDADEDKANNTTSTVKTVVKTTNYPSVTDLAGTQTGGEVKLTWSEPDMTAAPAEPVTDSFEDYEAFAINTAGSWSFVDVDGSENYVLDGTEIPYSGQAAAYIVLDGSYEAFNASFAAHSGDKYMASFAAVSGQNNDWMISPELDGGAQTVSFWAKTYTAQYGSESFEFYYSTTGKETSDFIKVGGDAAVPTDWTEYSYDIPAGAKYFAIRCTSADRFIFLVDDVTYTPAGGAPAELAIVGYNIYRDGVKLNAEPVEETTYTDAAATAGEHAYVVTVVYDKGESKASNIVTVDVASGISAVAASAARISAAGRTIVVAGAEGENITVSTADGKMVFSGKADAVTHVGVNGGLYIVKVGDTVTKAVVK